MSRTRVGWIFGGICNSAAAIAAGLVFYMWGERTWLDLSVIGLAVGFNLIMAALQFYWAFGDRQRGMTI